MWLSNCPNAICWKNYLSTINDFEPCQKSVDNIHEFISEQSILFHWIPISQCLHYDCIAVTLEIMCLATLFFFSRLSWFFWVTWIHIRILRRTCQYLPRSQLGFIRSCWISSSIWTTLTSTQYSVFRSMDVGRFSIYLDIL